MLAAFGFEEPDEPNAAYARAYVGAILVHEHMRRVEQFIEALAKTTAQPK